jgi:hypothetical protein
MVVLDRVDVNCVREIRSPSAGRFDRVGECPVIRAAGQPGINIARPEQCGEREATKAVADEFSRC